MKENGRILWKVQGDKTVGGHIAWRKNCRVSEVWVLRIYVAVGILDYELKLACRFVYQNNRF